MVSQEELETAVWGDEYIEDPDRLRSVIKNLRKALDTDAVQLATKWGEGFILREATPERKSE